MDHNSNFKYFDDLFEDVVDKNCSDYEIDGLNQQAEKCKEDRINTNCEYSLQSELESTKNTVAVDGLRCFPEFITADFDSLGFAVQYSSSQDSTKLKEKFIREIECFLWNPSSEFDLKISTQNSHISFSKKKALPKWTQQQNLLNEEETKNFCWSESNKEGELIKGNKRIKWRQLQFSASNTYSHTNSILKSEDSIQTDRYYIKTCNGKFAVWHIIPDGAWETLYDSLDFVFKKNFYCWKIRLNKLNQYQMLEIICKTQMKNSKDYQYTLFSSITPYL